MTLSQALRNAIFCVFSNASGADCGHLPAEDVLETMACLYRLLFATEADEEKTTPKSASAVDKEDEPYLTPTDIARQLGVLSQVTHNPHPTAVATIINDYLWLEPHEYKKTGDGTLYASSVISKVKNWLRDYNFPAKIISISGEHEFHVVYAGKGDESTT